MPILIIQEVTGYRGYKGHSCNFVILCVLPVFSCDTMPFKVAVNLRLQFLLDIGIECQQMGGIGQSIGCGLVACQQYHSSISNNLLIG